VVVCFVNIGGIADASHCLNLASHNNYTTDAQWQLLIF